VTCAEDPETDRIDRQETRKIESNLRMSAV
jgi:hypothetical protein